MNHFILFYKLIIRNRPSIPTLLIGSLIFYRQQRVIIADSDTAPFLAYKQRCASGHYTWTKLPKNCKILAWAQDNLMTINLTKTKEMVVKVKLSDLFLLSLLKSIRKNFSSFQVFWAFFCFIIILQIETSKIDALLSKAGKSIHILGTDQKV